MEQVTSTSKPRKRINTTVSGSLTSLIADNDLPSRSQLPSPLSSIDENMKTVGADSAKDPFSTTPSITRRRRSTAKSIREARSPPSTNERTTSDRMDIPLAVALVPPLGSFLTGGDFLRDVLLFLLLFFYLHQLIKIPWELYLASRPRGRRVLSPDTSSDQERLHNLIQSELKTAEFAYLTLSVLAPLIGAALLRYVGTALTGKDYISWFSTGVFVLVTGVRPWRHLGHRLRARTEELQEAMLELHTVGEDFPCRMTRLEQEIAQLKEMMITKDALFNLHKEINESLNVLDDVVAKHERAVEIARDETNERLNALERALMDPLQVGGAKPQHKTWTRTLTSPSNFFDWLLHPHAITPFGKVPTTPARSARPTYKPRLAAVEEEGGSDTRTGVGPRVQPDGLERWLDLLVYPFSLGRALLMGILHFLHRLV